MFKKVVVADNCATFANHIFSTHETQNGSALALGAVFFAIQIYGDFSGYSDMALGTARLLGFELLQNFRYPYFSRDIAEFWRRWHISLSSWFRDYLYFPLGGSRGGMVKTIRNTFVIFLVSGFWHGANWTFIMWGALNACFILPSIVLKTNRNNLDTVAQGKLLPNFKETGQLIFTFCLASFAWIFFRSPSISEAFSYINGIFSKSFFEVPTTMSMMLVFNVVVFLIIEWLGRENKYALEKLGLSWKSPIRWAFYYILIMVILFFGGQEQTFIYFQF